MVRSKGWIDRSPDRTQRDATSPPLKGTDVRGASASMCDAGENMGE